MNTVVYDHQTFALQQYGGISRYFCELAARINRSDDFRSRVVAPLHFNDHLAACEAPTTGIRMRVPHPRVVRLYRAVNRMVAPRLVRAAGPALVHRTYYGPPARYGRMPTVVTVFDMIHELFSEEFASSDPTSADKRRSVREADRVLCISKSTAADLIRLFDVPPQKISVTYLGYSEAFSTLPGDGEPPPNSRPYLLYVGHRNGYKNFRGALRAFAASPALREAFDFVAFGGYSFNADELTFIRSLRLAPGKVVRLGGSDVELAKCYRHARALVYPSLYEGFGIPPLEAMSSGCAVTCSNTSSIPEVAGDAALLFDPHDVDAMRSAMETVGFDDTTRARLVEAGRAQVQRFSWDRCALDTLGAYRATLGL